MMVNLPCLMVSCTNFLRPTCPYTECPLSFLIGFCPTEGTTAGYSSCLYLDFTGLPFHTGYGYSVDASPCFGSLVIVLMQCLSHSSVIGFLSRTRPGLGILRNPARLWNIQFCCFGLCSAHFCFFRASDVHQHLLRIIDGFFLQDRVDDPEKLKGDHEQ